MFLSFCVNRASFGNLKDLKDLKSTSVPVSACVGSSKNLMAKGLHPRISHQSTTKSSGGILQSQADRGEARTFHSPGNGTG